MGMAAVAIIRLEHDAAWLRRVTSRSSDSDAARRMLALSFALETAFRADAVRLGPAPGQWRE